MGSARGEKTGNKYEYSSRDFAIEKNAQTGEFGILFKGQPLRTPLGKPMISSNEKLFEAMCDEIVATGTMEVEELSLYSMCCTWLDFAQADEPMFDKESVNSWLEEDLAYEKACLCFRYNADAFGDEVTKNLLSIKKYFETNGIQLAFDPLPEDLDGDFDDASNRSEFRKAVAFITNKVLLLSPVAQTSLINCVNVFNVFVPGLILVESGITPRQFAQMIVASRIGESDEYMEPHLSKYSDEIAMFEREASKIMKFLELAS